MQILYQWVCEPTCDLDTFLSYRYPWLQLAGLLKQLEFIIVPVANPDGYYVSHNRHHGTLHNDKSLDLMDGCWQFFTVSLVAMGYNLQEHCM